MRDSLYIKRIMYIKKKALMHDSIYIKLIMYGKRGGVRIRTTGQK